MRVESVLLCDPHVNAEHFAYARRESPVDPDDEGLARHVVAWKRAINIGVGTELFDQLDFQLEARNRPCLPGRNRQALWPNAQGYFSQPSGPNSTEHGITQGKHDVAKLSPPFKNLGRAQFQGRRADEARHEGVIG